MSARQEKVREALDTYDPQGVEEAGIVNAALAEVEEWEADADKPNLGLATTGELLDELRARCEVNGTISYRTVDSI